MNNKVDKGEKETKESINYTEQSFKIIHKDWQKQWLNYFFRYLFSIKMLDL